jgi:hypothetical protein
MAGAGRIGESFLRFFQHILHPGNHLDSYRRGKAREFVKIFNVLSSVRNVTDSQSGD